MLANVVKRLKTDKRFQWEMITLACMYFGYAALYMCRATVVNLGTVLLDDPTLGLTKTYWGIILGWGNAGNLVGKLANGVLADRFGGRRIFMLSLAFCMVATGIFGTMSGVLLFSVLHFIALFAKSAGWPSMSNLIGVWYQPSWRGRIWGILSSSSRFSSVFTILAVGSLLLVLGWRESSSPGESHPQALTEPDVNLSAHPAPIVQSQVEFQSATFRTGWVLGRPLGPTSEPPAVDDDGIV